LSVGKTNLLLRNLLRTPVLELEAAKINLGKNCSKRTATDRLAANLAVVEIQQEL
jgi:hypothetical protein